MTCYRNKGRQRGFTLVEMVVALSIVAILAAIALPSFKKQTLRSKRSDALVALQQAAAAQERFYAINARYVANADPAAGTASITSPQQLYTITVAINATATTFTATATPVAGRTQANDSDCTTFTLTNTGAQGSTGTYASGGSPGNCWK